MADLSCRLSSRPSTSRAATLSVFRVGVEVILPQESAEVFFLSAGEASFRLIRDLWLESHLVDTCTTVVRSGWLATDDGALVPHWAMRWVVLTPSGIAIYESDELGNQTAAAEFISFHTVCTPAQ